MFPRRYTTAKHFKSTSTKVDCVSDPDGYRCCVWSQVFQLQQEKKKLQEDFSALLQDRESLERRCASIQREQTQLGPRLEETKWEVGARHGLETVHYDPCSLQGVIVLCRCGNA